MSLAHFDLILVALRAAKLESLESSLDRAVEDEATSLAALPPSQGGRRRPSRQDALELARLFYGEEIFHAVRSLNLEPPTPDQILSHRRTPTVWAIATLMRAHGIDLWGKGP